MVPTVMGRWWYRSGRVGHGGALFNEDSHALDFGAQVNVSGPSPRSCRRHVDAVLVGRGLVLQQHPVPAATVTPSMVSKPVMAATLTPTALATRQESFQAPPQIVDVVLGGTVC